MKSSVLVIDDFYSDPHGVRREALRSDFSLVGQYPGRRTAPFHSAALRTAIQDIVDSPIVAWPEERHNCAFQITLASDRTWIHCDKPTNMAGVLYLTPDAPVDSGTTFYEHRGTGLRSEGEDPETQALTRGDARHPNRWTVTDRIANRFNRLILFDSHVYHQSTSSFGDTLENGRLFQSLFFTVGEARSRSVCSS